jgi:hypothetical protein
VNEVALLGLVGALHVLALAGGVVLVLALARGDDRRGRGSDGPTDGGGPSPLPPSPPSIGPPLPDAAQSRVRLREAGRIAGGRLRRRPESAPVPPSRRAPRAAKLRKPS